MNDYQNYMNVSLSENENEGVNMNVNGNADEDEDANKNMERNADVNKPLPTVLQPSVPNSAIWTETLIPAVSA